MSNGRLKYIVALIALLIPLLCSGQAKVFTKKARIADFAAKTTKVVMSGNEAIDTLLRDEIASRWRISPYEFCSKEEFEAQKTSSKYYFLYIKEDATGLSEMFLMKGGGKGGSSNLDSRMDVISVPVNEEFMPVIIDIVQTYVENSIVSEAKGFLGLSSYNGNLRKVRRRQICHTDRLLPASEDKLMAFTISSAQPGKKSKTAMFIVTADTHELYYYKKRGYRTELEKSFTDKELKTIKREHNFGK